jgi:hypothetical protein
MHAHPPRHARRPALTARVLDRSLRRTLDRSGALLLLAAAGAMLAVILLVLAVTPAHAAASTREVPSRTLTGAYPIGDARRLELGFAFGKIRVQGTDGSQVRVRVEASCNQDTHEKGECEAFLKDLHLEGVNRNGALRVRLVAPHLFGSWDLDGSDADSHRHHRSHDSDGEKNYEGDNSDIRIVVEVPRSLDVELKVGAGELEINDLREDLSINMGAGDINVHMPSRNVGTVDVTMAIGETTIREGGRTHEFARVLGGPIHWRDGKGDAGIDVSVGAGEVEVTLE